MKKRKDNVEIFTEGLKTFSKYFNVIFLVCVLPNEKQK